MICDCSIVEYWKGMVINMGRPTTKQDLLEAANTNEFKPPNTETKIY